MRLARGIGARSDPAQHGVDEEQRHQRREVDDRRQQEPARGLVIEEAGEAPGHGMMMLFDMPDSTMVRLVAFEPGSTEVPVVLYEGEVGRFSASPIDLEGRSVQGLAFEIREAGTDKVLLKNSLA